ncbi:hypothetical protein B0T16DRAFT_422231 [Cercophora newfieldiana]|uniref:NACHT-NTPase and P-loop NTPases N-terminal domain-containing protein n=1 Tax=Cercophora newfieldiana TaxID=92897 RepID=A0AA39XRP8_9PEZI|nr:hypothetical protein B0T16DRAFT_422231 [Cercophora newfieldiana]
MPATVDHKAALRRTTKVITAIEELQDQTENITKAKDLPSAFAGVAKAFPIAEQVLQCVESSLKDKAKVEPGNQDNDEHLKTIKQILDETGSKAEDLYNILERVLPEDKKSREERYKDVVTPSTTVEKLMLAVLQDLLEVSQLPLPLVDPMTLKLLQDTIKDVQKLEPSIKPPEKGAISFLNSGPGTQIGHAGTGDIYHNPGNGPQIGGKMGNIYFGAVPMGMGYGHGHTPPSEPSSRASTPVTTSRKSWLSSGGK